MHYIKRKGAIEGQKLPGRPRNLYISQLKKDVRIYTYAGLKTLRLQKKENEVKFYIST